MQHFGYPFNTNEHYEGCEIFYVTRMAVCTAWMAADAGSQKNF